MRAQVVDALIGQLAGADHLGSLLKIDDALDRELTGETFSRAVGEQGEMFTEERFSPAPTRELISADTAKASLLARLEEFLGKHTSSADLGLRLRGEQLAAGVRFVRMVKEGQYHLVVGNPPYQGTSKMADAGYVAKHYPKGKADLYAAFLIRGLELAREGGRCAMITMRNWMFIAQYSLLRELLLETYRLSALGDLSWGAFEEMRDNPVTMVVLSNAKWTALSAAVVPSDLRGRVRTNDEVYRKNAGLLCQADRHEFDVQALKAVPEWPLVYWWDDFRIRLYRSKSLLGQESPARQGLATGNNSRFVRMQWEVRQDDVGRQCKWAPYIKGAAGRAWIEGLDDVVRWHMDGAEVEHFETNGKQASRPQNRSFYFKRGVAFSMIGSDFRARMHREPSIFGHKGSSVFPGALPQVVCMMNSALARSLLESLNPGIGFEVGDVNRLPVFTISSADEIFATIEAAFTTHESHREPSFEFRTPGPSPWRHAQAWAQLAVDRPENTPLPPYEEQLDPPPATDHVSFALGVALGRFDQSGAGILDPQSVSLTHALPHGLLFLDGTQPTDSTLDGLGHPACAPLHAAWDTHRAQIDTKRTALRDYLRLDFFDDVHRKMYENRPIHWPLSSAKKTFVAWVNIHRWDASTLRILLADHLHPTKQRLDVELAELRKVRDGADKKAARAADKRLDLVTQWRDELAEFIANVAECAERGPPPPDAKTPKRTDDAPYEPDLDDGVMINSAALWPLLAPQWKDPKKWWKELATAEGRKDYDWSHLAARYFADRVDAKCQKDPSLAVAHRCFWKYHPDRAYAWELRLQDEIRPDFRIDEPDSDEARDRFFYERRNEAVAIEEKEKQRRAKKRAKADEDAQLETDEVDADEESSDD